MLNYQRVFGSFFCLRFCTQISGGKCHRIDRQLMFKAKAPAQVRGTWELHLALFVAMTGLRGLQIFPLLVDWNITVWSLSRMPVLLFPSQEETRMFINGPIASLTVGCLIPEIPEKLMIEPPAIWFSIDKIWHLFGLLVVYFFSNVRFHHGMHYRIIQTGLSSSWEWLQRPNSTKS